MNRINSMMFVFALFVALISLGYAEPIKSIKKINPGTATSFLNAMTNGKVEVGDITSSCSDGGENSTVWNSLYEFTEASPEICVKWTDKVVPDSADWQLFSVNPDKLLASEKLTPELIANPSSIFRIKFSPPLEKFNTTPNKKKYKVNINSHFPNNFVKFASAGLVHLPKPPPVNPYTSCTSGPDRKVLLEIPSMTVNKTSSTSGDGDRDELYVSVDRRGPGSQSSANRLPSADDYYEAINLKTVTKNRWTNKNQSQINNPVLWSGIIKNNELMILDISLREQDNADLPEIKDKILKAMTAVATAAQAIPTYGQAIAAAAMLIGAGSQIIIPDTKGHDFIGYVRATVSNECGFIKTSWITFTTNGTVSSQFENNRFEGFESRFVTLEAREPGKFGFIATDADWGVFQKAGDSDEFWWLANGTSGSKYTFRLGAKALIP